MGKNNLMSRLEDDDVDLTNSSKKIYSDNRYIGHGDLHQELNNVEELRKAWEEAKKIAKDQSEATIAKFCYTLEWPNFYRVCNKEMRKWYHAQSKNNFPFNNYVKLLESQCLKFPNELTLYRGIRNKNPDLIKDGSYITSNQFFSCSIVKSTAQHFAKNGMLLIIKTNFAIEIGDNSVYPGEREFVIPPGMLFEIVSSKRRVNQSETDELTLKIVEVVIATEVNKDLVLDMSNGRLQVQKYNGSPKQKWFIQGRYIRSSFNGHAVDIDYPNIRKDQNVPKGTSLMTWPLHCRANQEWFWSADKTIESGVNDFVMDVDVKVEEGARVIVWSKNKKPNQLFNIINVMN